MPIRWYISPYAGTGTPDDAFRAAAWDVTDPELNQLKGGIRCTQRRHYIVKIDAPQAIHDRIIAETGSKPVSPLFSDDAAEDLALDGEFSASTISADAEAAGYSVEWVGSNTLRDVLRYFIRVAHLAQRLEKTPLATRIFTLGLTATVGDLTTQQRNAVRNWMTDRGLATGWITNATTIRQVLHFIVLNLGIGKLKIAGKEF